MSSVAMHLKMAKKGRPVHCADGKWRTEKEADWFSVGWQGNISCHNTRKSWRLAYIAGFKCREAGR